MLSGGGVNTVVFVKGEAYMKSLLLVERFVLEKVGTQGITINELVTKTELSSSVIQATLYHLKSEGIVDYKNGKYFISSEQKEKWKKIFSEEKSKKFELMDLFSQILNFYYKSEKKGVDLKMERANLDAFEYKLLQTHISNLNDFFKNLKLRKKQPENAQEYLFLYANSLFPSLVKASVV